MQLTKWANLAASFFSGMGCHTITLSAGRKENQHAELTQAAVMYVKLVRLMKTYYL